MKARKVKRAPRPTSASKMAHGPKPKTGPLFLLKESLQNIACHLSAEERRMLAAVIEKQANELRSSADLMDARQILTEAGRN